MLGLSIFVGCSNKIACHRLLEFQMACFQKTASQCFISGTGFVCWLINSLNESCETVNVKARGLTRWPPVNSVSLTVLGSSSSCFRGRINTVILWEMLGVDENYSSRDKDVVNG